MACLAALSSQVCAYPGYFSGDVTKAVPGGAFGNMGVPNYAAGNSAVCEITSNIPAVGFTVGEAYTFKISTSNANGLGMVWDVSGTKGNSGTRRHAEKEVAWTATGDSAFAHAICGAGGGFRGVHVAASVTVKKKTATTTTDDVTPAIRGDGEGELGSRKLRMMRLFCVRRTGWLMLTAQRSTVSPAVMLATTCCAGARHMNTHDYSLLTQSSVRGLSVWLLFGLSVGKGEGEGEAEGQLYGQGGEGEGKLGSRKLRMHALGGQCRRRSVRLLSALR